MARIDTPCLDYFSITLFDQIISNTSQLVHFVNCTPNLKEPNEAHAIFDDGAVWVTVSSPGSGKLSVKIPCVGPERQLVSLAQFCTLLSPLLFTVEDLFVYKQKHSQSEFPDEDIDNTQWTGLLCPFTAVKNLYLCELFAPPILLALQELLEERMTEAFPILQNIFIGGLWPPGPAQKAVDQFRVAARQLSSHPIVVSDWIMA